MNRRNLLVACIVALGLVCGAKPALAQHVGTPKSGTTLTGESLGKMLEGLGMKPKAGKYPNGLAWYDVEMNLDGWTPTVRIALSTDGRVIWSQLNLAILPTTEQIPVERLIKIMRMSGATSKAQFCIRENNLVLLQSMDNADVTPVRLRAELQELCVFAKANYTEYSPANWKVRGPRTPEQLRELGALSGTSMVVGVTLDGKSVPIPADRALWVEITDCRITARNEKGETVLPLAPSCVDSSKAPKHIDLVNVDGTNEGIYKLEGDTLTICVTKQVGKRLEAFVTQGTMILVLKRVTMS